LEVESGANNSSPSKNKRVTKCYKDDQDKAEETGRASSMNAEECIWDIGGKTRKKEATSNKTGVRIILKWILEKYDGVLWTGLIWVRVRIIEEFL
jgi:hypothetical protein